MNQILGVLTNPALGGSRRRREREPARARRDSHRGDHFAMRCRLGGQDRGGLGHRLPLGAVEEPRQDLVPVLPREHLREGDDAGDAEPAVAEGLDHLGEALHQLGGHLAVVGGALREAELAVEEIEERRVPELEPAPLAVEGGEGEEEVGESALLLAEEPGEAGGLFQGTVHGESVSPEFRASPDARGWLLARDSEWGYRTSTQCRAAPSGAPG